MQGRTNAAASPRRGSLRAANMSHRQRFTDLLTAWFESARARIALRTVWNGSDWGESEPRLLEASGHAGILAAMRSAWVVPQF